MATIPAGVPRGRRFDFQETSYRGPVVYRQVRAAFRDALWLANPHANRWNAGFPALYTSLSLELALTERVKRTAGVPVDVVVGIADVVAARVAELSSTDALASLGLSLADVTGLAKDLPQVVGRSAYDLGFGGLLVPAAIQDVALDYPYLEVTRDRRARVATPRAGTNLVLFPDRLSVVEGVTPREEFACTVRGLTR